MFIIIVTVEVAISGSTGMFRHTHPLYKAHDGLPIPAFYPFSKNTSRSEALHLAAANGGGGGTLWENDRQKWGYDEKTMGIS